MSMYGSQRALHSSRRSGSRGDLTAGGNYQYARSEVVHGGGNGYGASDPFMDGFASYTYSKASMGGGLGTVQSGSAYSAIHQKAFILQGQCQDYLKKSEHALQSGASGGDAERYMAMAKEIIEQLKNCAIDLRQLGQPNDNVVRSVEICRDQLKGVHMAITGTMQRRSRGSRGSAGGWEETERTFNEATGWIGQQKRLIETSSWGEDSAAIEQQFMSHQKFHTSIQRSSEVDRARDELIKKGDKANLHALDQEWDSLQKMSFGRSQQLRELQNIIEEISREIMWVNDREEEELVFDWGDKNIDQYIPKKQESYSKLMSILEEKEKDLNKLKTKVDVMLKNNHPASDKIEAYMDTLQTQWSWLLKVTKCIDTHLKENAAYSQFFKEANETYSVLQKEHEAIRKKFSCDKNTSLDDLLELLKALEIEKETILDNKRHVQHLVSKSKSIVRLKPRNPEDKSNTAVIVQALCDFKQDQKVICKDNEGILKDNSQRSKWQVTGPGGLDMLVPSVCLIIPPPNPLSISLANKNEQYYEAILSIWNQLYINIKSLISWQYCLLDIKRINALTIATLSSMRSEEYRSIIKSLETHYGEFKLTSHGSQMFADEDKRSIENQYTGAQTHYDQLVVQLPAYKAQQQIEVQQVEQPLQQHQLIIVQQQQHQPQHLHQQHLQQQHLQQHQQVQHQQHLQQQHQQQQATEVKKVEVKKTEVKREAVNKEHVIKKDVTKVTKAEPVVRRKIILSSSSSSSSASSSSHSLVELHALRMRLEAAEGGLIQHVHICLGEDGVHDCGVRITQLEIVQHDINSIREEYLRLKERILKELEGMTDSDKAQFLRSEISVINQKLASLESSSSAYLQRLQALRDLLESVARAEDIVKVHEARLTEKETTSLQPSEVEDYMYTLKNMKVELGQKRDVLASMEVELDKASLWDGQVCGSFHKCDMILSKYNEQVGLLSDRWRRIQNQINCRLQDLELYLPQLQHYQRTSTSLSDWISATRKREDSLQATKIEDVQTLNDHINLQKALNSEIKGKRETVESVLRDTETCVNSIKDYESDLASYSSGLETLLNIPIKRTMLKSPSMDLTQEATSLQTRYMELLTLSGDYYKYLGEMLKNMEALKIRNTRIDLLEEELRLLKEDIQDCNTKNRALEEALGRYQLELSQSQDQLLSVEEVKRNTVLQCSATQDSLDSTHSQLADLNDQLARLNYLIEEEKRKRKLAEEHHTKQQEEYETVLRKRQKELEDVNWSKTELEKSVADKEREVGQLRRQLGEEVSRVKALHLEVSKLEEELNRIKLSLESELRHKQRLQDENDRVKKDLVYWKDQYDSKGHLLRQYESEKEHLEQERKSLKSEIDRLMRELRDVEETYKNRLSALQKEMSDITVVRKTMETELKTFKEPPTLDQSTLIFDGVRKPVTAQQLLDCGVLDSPTFNQLGKGQKTVPEVSVDKKVSLKGTGPIAGVIVEDRKGRGSIPGPKIKMSLTEAKKENLLPPDSADLLLDAQAATGHIIDPRTNQKLTVEEACDQGVVDEEDLHRLLAAEAAAVGYLDPHTGKPLSAVQAMKKGLIDKNTALRLLQAQESVGGILDPILSVFLPKDVAMERNLLDEDMYRALNQRPELYLDPETELGASYLSLKRRCKTEPRTGLLLLPISKKLNPSDLLFDGVRKPVTAKQLLDCGVLDKPTFNQLVKGEKSIPEVSVDEKVSLKGTGPIAGVVVGRQGKMSFAEAKKKNLLPPDCAYLLLDAQAATGHIIDPRANQKLTVEEACARGVVDKEDIDILLAAEAAAVGYQDPSTGKPLSVFEAMKKGRIDRNTALTLLQAQESVGGILDPVLSVFLPKDTAIKRNLLDEDLNRALDQSPECYLDPETDLGASYGSLKKRCKTEPHTGLLLLPVPEKLDPSNLLFDGVRKPVTAQQLLDCGVLDKPTFNQLVKGEKSVPEVSVDKKVSLKGTGPIAGVVAGRQGKISFTEAKKKNLLLPGIANLLLDAQAATGHIIDPRTNQKLTVEEACARGVVDKEDRDMLLAAEAAAIGYQDPTTGKRLSVFEAMKKGVIDKNTALHLLQAQVSVGGFLDPVLSVFLPKDTAIKRNLLDEDLHRVLSQSPECYLDPETELGASYGSLMKRCKTEPHTGLLLLPVPEKLDPSNLLFDGVRKPVTAQQLLDCGVLDKPTFNQLLKEEKYVPEVSVDKKVSLKGTGPIAGVVTGRQGKMSFAEAKKKNLLPADIANLLLDAQAATGHIIDPRANQKLTVEEACARGVVDKEDLERLSVAEAAAVGYRDPSTDKPLSVAQAMRKGLIDRDTTLRMLQAQESVGGILDPVLSVFLPKDTAIKRKLLDEDLRQDLSQSPECYLDPETELGASYGSLKKRCKTETHTGLLLLPVPEKLDPSNLLFDGVRKPVTAEHLHDCGVLDKPTFNQLVKGKKSVPEVSVDKNVSLKGTGPIAGVVAGRQGKMSFAEAKKKNLLPADIANLLLDAQAATGHIIDPRANQKLTVEEACARGVVDKDDVERLSIAEAAAVGYRDPSTDKPLSVAQAMRKGLIDRDTTLRMLQAQESVGGILDPVLSVFLPMDTAIKRKLIDEHLRQALSQSPECYLDPETELGASYGSLKKRCEKEPHTGLLLLPVPEKVDPSNLLFDGVRKPVTAEQLHDCGVLDKPTFNQLVKGEKSIPEVSVDKKVSLKGTGPIAGVVAGRQGKMSFAEAKKKNLLPADIANLLLDAQAATGHIIDPRANQKLTVEEACARGVVDKEDLERLSVAEAAAVGYRDPSTNKPLSVAQAMRKDLIDRKTTLRMLQAQESVGGILDPVLSVFLPKDTAIKRNLLDEDLNRALDQSPECYLDPETKLSTSYGSLKKRCEKEPHTGLLLLPVPDKLDPSNLLFDGVRKPVTAEQLHDCGVLDKPTFNQLVKGEKSVPEVSVDKKVSLKGTGPIAGVVAGRQGKMSFAEAKKKNLLPADIANLLLDAQAATGHIIDPRANQKLTVEEACARGVVDKEDLERLSVAEAAAVGYRDPSTNKPLSVAQAMRKDLIDRKTTLRMLQAQESVGGILDPVLSVFLPKDTAIKRNLLDEDLNRALDQSPECYLDPETKLSTSYGSLKKRCEKETHTGLLLLPVPDKLDPSNLLFDGVRKPVTAEQLHDCGVLDKPTFNQLVKGEKSVPEVSVDKKVSLKGTGPIAGVVAGRQGKMSFAEAKKKNLLPADIANLLLDAQAATGHIIDPRANQKLTVEEACARGVVDKEDLERLSVAEAAAVGYRDPSTNKPLSVAQAMRKDLIDRKTTLRMLQAQESVGGILDPVLSVFLPKDTAIKRNLLDEDLNRALDQSPECYLDPETKLSTSYGSLKKRCEKEPHTGLLLLPVPDKLDPSNLLFDGVRKPVTAEQLHDCGVLDKPTFNQLVKGEKSVPEVSVDKKVSLKGTGPIAGVVAGRQGKMSFAEAKKKNLLPADIAHLLLDAQAATGHIVDPRANQKLTVEEACARGVVDKEDLERLSVAEAAAVGYRDPSTNKPLSVAQAMRKGLIDRDTTLRMLQAQESVGGILDPVLSVFLPKDTAIKRNLLDEDLYRALSQSPGCYLDPETKLGTSYGSLKKRCEKDTHTGLLLLPVPDKLDPSNLLFDGVRKPVTAEQLHDCGVLDKPTFNQLVKGEKSVPEVSVDKKVSLKGTGPIAGVVAGRQGKMSFAEAKKKNLLPADIANLLLDAQAATGHIVDPRDNQKLTVEEACARGVVDKEDLERLSVAEAAAVGYRDPSTNKPLSVAQAMRKGLIDRDTTLRMLQAQESVGGILDPVLSVFLPKDAALKRNLLDNDLYRALSQSPACYLDPETELGASYGSLKKRCKTETDTGLLLLPVTDKLDPSNLLFDGVRKPVTAQQLLDCGVLDKPTFNQLVKGEKTVPEVSVDKKVYLKGTGSIDGVAAGPLGKMSFTEAKKGKIMSSDSANLLLDAQAATGHIMDPRTNQKLTVEEACAKGVVDKEDLKRLLVAEAGAVGYRDPSTAKPLSAGQAMRKGLIDKDTALRILQAQESVGGILDPVLSVFLPKDAAIKRNLLDEDLYRALSQSPACYLDPETKLGASYGSLKKRCKIETQTGLLLLPDPDKLDPSNLLFDGVRKPVTAQQLLDCGVLDKPTFNQLVKGEKTVPEVSVDKKVYLKGTGSIDGVAAGPLGKMSFTEAKKGKIMSSDSANLLLDAQAATGHIMDPRTNQKLTVEEACAKGVVDKEDLKRLLVAEAGAVGYRDPSTAKPLSAGQAMRKGLIDKDTALQILQAQESVGGILDPVLSVFLPKDAALKRNLLDEDLYRALSQNPGCYLDPETKLGASYGSLKKRCKIETQTGLLLLPVPDKLDPSNLLFDGVRKPVTAQQLLDCGVLDKPTFNQLVKGEKTVPEVSVDKKVYLKGTGSIDGVAAGPLGKMSFTEAKKGKIMSSDSANLLLDAQAATGHIMDPRTNQKLTVEEACAKGVVDKEDLKRLLVAEAGAVGYRDPSTAKPLSAGQAMRKGLIDKNTALRILQAQESVGGILDPVLSVFLPKDAAIKRNLLDEDLYRALSQSPACYLDPETELGASYGSLKKRCKTETDTGLLLLPVPEKLDPSNLLFDGVRKPVTAQQLLDCGVLDKPTFNQLVKGEKTVPEVSVDKKVYLKGTGSIDGVAAGPLGKMSFTEAKKGKIMSSDSANLLLDAQAATGHIMDPKTNQKLTVEEACAKGVVDKEDLKRLLVAEAGAVGYRDPSTAKPLSAGQAMRKGLIDKDTALQILQAQESVGGILDPVLSVFLPKDAALKRNLLDEDLYRALSQNPGCYLDPETKLGASYGSLKKRCKIETQTGLLLLPVPDKLDPSNLLFDGVRKPVTAQQLLDCGVLDKPTFNQLVKGEKTVPEVSVDKKVYLKGTGSIDGVAAGPLGKMSFTEAKKGKIMSSDSANLLLDAQAATGHIMDPRTNQKLTVEEACAKGVVDKEDLKRLLVAEAGAVGYRDPSTAKPLSAGQAMRKGLIDKNTALRILQAQESVGGILDPVLSVFLPKDAAIKRNLLDEDLYRALSQSPACYLDPETELGASYGSLKKRCKTETDTGLLLLPVPEKLDPSNLLFDGVRKPVTAQQLLDCGVLDKPTFNQLVKGEKTVPEVSVDKKVYLKGTGSIDGVAAGPLGKMSFTEAKKGKIMSSDSANLLLDAQAATGHIMDPKTNQKLTVEEACAKGVVDKEDLKRLLVAEAGAVGYRDPSTAKPLSAGQAMRKGLIDKDTALRILQAQESVGGILDPVLSVFLPKDAALKRNLLDEDLYRALSQNPGCYLDPETKLGASYGSLKKRCKIETQTGLLLLPVPDKLDPSNLLFDGVRKPVTAQQLLDCGVLDKPTFNQLVKGEKTVPEVSVDKKVYLKGTGSIDGVAAGPLGKMSFTEAKKGKIMSSDSANLLLDAQAATGHIMDPRTNQKLTVEEACAKGVVDKEDLKRLLVAEAGAVGYRDPSTAKPLSAGQAMRKGLIDKNTALRILQAQESVGGILDPVLSVFLPKDAAIKRNLLDEDLYRALSQSPACYLDPETELGASYGSLKKRCKTETDTGLLLLPVPEKLDPSNLLFDGVRKPVTAQQLLDCGVLDKPTFNQLVKGEKTVPEVSVDKKVYLKGTGSIDGVAAGPLGKMSFTEAKKGKIMSSDSANLLLDAQAATGHIMDPRTNQKLTVEEACAKGVVDKEDLKRLLVAEAGAVGYRDPSTAKPLSAGQAMRKGLIDKDTALRILQAQESVGGILDPVLSVFLPKDAALKRNLLDEDLYRALSQNPGCYLDPETKLGASYGSLKKRCKIETQTGLLLLPVPDQLDPSNLLFDGVCRSVTAQQLLDCGVLDRPTFDQLVKGEKSVSGVSVDKKVYLKGTGSIGGVTAGPLGKMSFTEAKKGKIMSSDSANLLLDAQAATGHIMDPKTNQKLTVEEACAKGVVDKEDLKRLLVAEAGAVGYRDPSTAKPLSAGQAMRKGLIDKDTALRILQAQESVGGILDPVLSVFLPKDAALKRNLLDEDLYRALSQNPGCYLDPESKLGASYGSLKKRCKTETQTGLLLLPVRDKLDPSNLLFDGVCRSVTAQQLLDCGVLDRPTFDQLVKGEKSVSEVSVDMKVYLKGTGSIGGVAAGPLGKMSFTEAKKGKIMSSDSANLLLDAQAATGHIMDPRTNQKLTVEEACAKGVVDKEDLKRLLVAEAGAVGYRDPSTAKPLSAGQAMRKGLIDKDTALRILQAQESVGGILDPVLSVFLPKDAALKRNLLDEDLYRALSQNPGCYLDPETKLGASYGSLKKRCKTETQTGLLLLPVPDKLDPSNLLFDGVCRSVTAQQLLDCGVLDRPTFDQLVKGEKSVSEVSVDMKVYLKGTGSIGGVAAGPLGKMSFTEAKKGKIMSSDSANLLLDAQAATGHIMDPRTNQKLTVEEACAKGVVDKEDLKRLLVAEAGAVGYRDPSTAKPLSAGQAMRKGLIDKDTALRILQAQESVGGILDPVLSVFLPKDAALKRNLLDEDLYRALSQNPGCYLDPESKLGASYGSLKKRCKTETQTGLLLLPVPDKLDPSNLLFDGVCRSVTAQQLLDCGVLDRPTFDQLVKGEKSVSEVSVDMKVYLKGTGSIGGVAAGPLGKMSFTEAKKGKIMSSDSANLLLDAQAATGHIMDPRTNQKLTVEEACAKGVVDKEDLKRLLVAEAGAVGYRDPSTAKPLSAGQAMRKGLIDKDTALQILQAQESVGGILDPVLSVFLPKDAALKRNLLDEDLYRALSQNPGCYLDPETKLGASYGFLKKRCKTDPSTGLLILPAPVKPLTVQGLRDQVSAIDLVDAKLLEPSYVDQLREGKLTSQEIEDRLRSYLRGSTCIAGVYDEASDKIMPVYQAMKEGLLQPGTTLELLEAQAASGFVVDPVKNLYLTVSDAYKRGLVGPEFMDKVLSAERAVTGYELPGTNKIISLFQAIEKGLVEKGHGIRLLEAQIASGGIIDPKQSHRIEVEVAYKRGYFDEKMNQVLANGGEETKGFFDPNTQLNLTYRELKKCCITDKKTGLVLLPIIDKKKQQESTKKNTMRKRRVVIVDPDTNQEMTVHEAYEKGLIDYETFLELSEQECEWEDITITAPDGSSRVVLVDRKTGKQYDVSRLLEQAVIDQSTFDMYRCQRITLTEFADIITKKNKYLSSSLSSSSLTTGTSAAASSVSSSSVSLRSSSLTTTKTTTITGHSTNIRGGLVDSLKHVSSVSINLASPVEMVGEQDPVGAILDTQSSEKISIWDAQNRGLVDSITAQRLLEAQACTGGIVNPINGCRLGIQEASRQGIIDDDMATRLKPAQKAYIGFQDVKNKRKMSAAEAMKENWLPYEAGHRFMEFQFVTGGLYDPELGCRRTIEDALKIGWLDGNAAQKLQDTRHHTKNLTCPKTKLNISYKEALDNSMVEKNTGVRLLQASPMSSRGISSPYNLSAPGSRTGSRSGSRRSSIDLGSPSSSVTSRTSYSYTPPSSRSTF